MAAWEGGWKMGDGDGGRIDCVRGRARDRAVGAERRARGEPKLRGEGIMRAGARAGLAAGEDDARGA
jgi:hypothetical protein